MSLLDGINRAHIIGAGGIGVSAVARLLKHAGLLVTGSDAHENETTRELIASGIPVANGHAAEHVPTDVDLVVYSGAVPISNPEREAAKYRKIRQLSYFEFIGEYSKEKWTVAVSGTNGKSTTTALLGLMLERAGLDPTVIVGSKVASFPDKNLRLGHGDHFVIEACEHEANMLKLFPQMIVLTNIEEDHLDFYRDIAHIREMFQQYVEKLPPDGTLLVNADDHVSFFELKPKNPFLTYGIENPADYMARNIAVGEGRQTFTIVRGGETEQTLGEFSLSIPGKFNVANALAAASAALELGVSPESIQKTLSEFPGIWRRFERVSTLRGAPVISDYGHHPTAIRETVEGAKQFYPGKRIVLAFQPHQRNRTRKLFNEFVSSFDGADVLLLPEIFDVTGRESSEDSEVSSRQLVDAVLARDSEHGRVRDVVFADSLGMLKDEIDKRVQSDDVVILMGAGNIYTIANALGA